ncbi:D-2-hydroxyacid dehydrogenase [Pararobbsia silviterrae]|uniref:D-2-hydroxyacid dehydrogenase n=1 Tax=Pararobbsia silviterrae TaxID=1792498 RepID=A0A494YAU4_9BURK|nr:D-2-hydroxyacid dehydrogenase [Pararobbsia silviterrae]RKP59285.1 D-2-hydroxyacid dehydrogenase [Pararobbsia silviterrae]
MDKHAPGVVFLDRASVDAELRPLSFAHRWASYNNTRVDQIVDRAREATVVITNKVPLRAATLAALPALRMIAVAATGTDIIDRDACAARGIVIANVRDYATASVPEHTFALILALRRQLLAYHADVRGGKWQKSERFCLLDHPIADLAGSRLGIIGLGSLGRAVAALGHAFGMDVCALQSRHAAADDAPAEPVTRLPLRELLATSDVVSLHMPLTEHTRHMIGRDELAIMKRSALLINTARGGLVDEVALAAALERGTIAGAGFDVLEVEPPPDGHPLTTSTLPNLLVTPHTAWASRQAMQRLADQLILNIEQFMSAHDPASHSSSNGVSLSS